MKDTLREYVQLQLEKIRGHAFNMNAFKQLDSLNQMGTYAEKNLKTLGAGSSRIAYALTSQRALKLAANNKGLAQNEEEVNVFTDPKTKLIIAKIYDYHPDFFWIISELVNPFNEDDEQSVAAAMNLTDPDIMFEEFIETVGQGDYQWLLDRGYDVSHLKDFAEAVQALVAGGSMVGDLSKSNSWGRAADGRVVLLDYGFSENVWANHYV